MGLSKSRDGKKPLYAKAKVVPVLTGEEIAGFVLDHVDPEAALFTDAYKGNLGLGELVQQHTMKGKSCPIILDYTWFRHRRSPGSRRATR